MEFDSKKIIPTIRKASLNALFPRRCPVCGGIPPRKSCQRGSASEEDRSGGEFICPSCLNQLSFVKGPVCKKCGKEVLSETQEYCFDCTRHKRSFEYGAALLNYNEAAGRSIAAAKYKNKREYLDCFGLMASEKLWKTLDRMNADALVPVPIHPARRRKRGFNQAEILAEHLSPWLRIESRPELLVRIKKTSPQKSLDPSGRLQNLEKAFAAGTIPEGIKSVILVDDIYTTGSTIEACTRALMKAGIKKVYFFALCIGQGA